MKSILLFLISALVTNSFGTLLKCGEDIVIERGQHKTLKFWSDDENLKVRILPANYQNPLTYGARRPIHQIPGLSQAIKDYNLYSSKSYNSQNKKKPTEGLHYAGNPEIQKLYQENHYTIEGKESVEIESTSLNEAKNNVNDSSIEKAEEEEKEIVKPTESSKLVTFIPNLGDKPSASTIPKQNDRFIKDVVSVESVGPVISALGQDLHKSSGSSSDTAIKDVALTDTKKVVLNPVLAVNDEVAEKPKLGNKDQVAENPVIDVNDEVANNPVLFVNNNPVFTGNDEIAEVPALPVKNLVAENPVLVANDDVSKNAEFADNIEEIQDILDSFKDMMTPELDYSVTDFELLSGTNFGTDQMKIGLKNDVVSNTDLDNMNSKLGNEQLDLNEEVESTTQYMEPVTSKVSAQEVEISTGIVDELKSTEIEENKATDTTPETEALTEERKPVATADDVEKIISILEVEKKQNTIVATEGTKILETTESVVVTEVSEVENMKQDENKYNDESSLYEESTTLVNDYTTDGIESTTVKMSMNDDSVNTDAEDDFKGYEYYDSLYDSLISEGSIRDSSNETESDASNVTQASSPDYEQTKESIPDYQVDRIDDIVYSIEQIRQSLIQDYAEITDEIEKLEDDKSDLSQTSESDVEEIEKLFLQNLGGGELETTASVEKNPMDYEETKESIPKKEVKSDIDHLDDIEQNRVILPIHFGGIIRDSEYEETKDSIPQEKNTYEGDLVDDIEQTRVYTIQETTELNISDYEETKDSIPTDKITNVQKDVNDIEQTRVSTIQETTEVNISDYEETKDSIPTDKITNVQKDVNDIAQTRVSIIQETTEVNISDYEETKDSIPTDKNSNVQKDVENIEQTRVTEIEETTELNISDYEKTKDSIPIDQITDVQKDVENIEQTRVTEIEETTELNISDYEETKDSIPSDKIIDIQEEVKDIEQTRVSSLPDYFESENSTNSVDEQTVSTIYIDETIEETTILPSIAEETDASPKFNVEVNEDEILEATKDTIPKDLISKNDGDDLVQKRVSTIDLDMLDILNDKKTAEAIEKIRPSLSLKPSYTLTVSDEIFLKDELPEKESNKDILGKNVYNSPGLVKKESSISVNDVDKVISEDAKIVEKESAVDVENSEVGGVVVVPLEVVQNDSESDKSSIAIPETALETEETLSKFLETKLPSSSHIIIKESGSSDKIATSVEEQNMASETTDEFTTLTSVDDFKDSTIQTYEETYTEQPHVGNDSVAKNRDIDSKVTVSELLESQQNIPKSDKKDKTESNSGGFGSAASIGSAVIGILGQMIMNGANSATSAKPVITDREDNKPETTTEFLNPPEYEDNGIISYVDYPLMENTAGLVPPPYPEYYETPPARKDDSAQNLNGEPPFYIKLPGSNDAVPLFIEYEPVQIKYVPLNNNPVGSDNDNIDAMNPTEFASRTGIENEINAIETDLMIHNNSYVNDIVNDSEMNEDGLSHVALTDSEYNKDIIHINIPKNFYSKNDVPTKTLQDPFVVIPSPNLDNVEHDMEEPINANNLVPGYTKTDESLYSDSRSPTTSSIANDVSYSNEHQGTIYGNVDLEKLHSPVFKLQNKVQRPSTEESMYPAYTPFPITTNPPKNTPSTIMAEDHVHPNHNVILLSEPNQRIPTQQVLENNNNEIDFDGSKPPLSTDFEEPPSIVYSPIPAVDFRTSFNPTGDLSSFMKENSPSFPSWYPQADVNDEEANVIRAAALTSSNPNQSLSERIANSGSVNGDVVDYGKQSGDDMTLHSDGADVVLPHHRRQFNKLASSEGKYGAFYHPADIPGMMLSDITERHLSLSKISPQSLGKPRQPWYKNSKVAESGTTSHGVNPSASLFLGPQFFQYLNNLPEPLLKDFIDPPYSERAVRVKRTPVREGEQVYCQWNVKTEPSLYLLITFQNLSAPYSIDCSGAYIEVEKENNGYDARWCGSRGLYVGARPHVIFAKGEVRITVFDDGNRSTDGDSFEATGFEADIDVIDLFNPQEYSDFMESNSYPQIRRLLQG